MELSGGPHRDSRVLLQADKRKKVALVASMRKRLVIFNAMLRKNQPWQLALNIP